MSKKKDNKRKGQLEAQHRFETLKFQVEYARKRLMPKLAADDAQLTAEMEVVRSNQLTNDLLELQSVFESMNKETQATSIGEKCSIRGAILPYLLGITAQNLLR